MANSVKLTCFLALLAGISAEKEQSRWSRQISSYTADISDWVPLPGPVREPPQIKRQAIAEPRILSEPFPGFARPTGFSQDFPSRMFLNTPANRQLYLQSVPSAPQNYLTDQGFGQSIRFGLAQPNFPLNQVFVAPQYNFDSIPQFKPKPTPIPTTQIKFDAAPSIPIQQPIIQAKPFIQAQKIKPESPKFVDGYRVENISRDAFIKNKPKSVPKIKFETYDKPQSEPIPISKTKLEREEVQLLYVPLESLNRGQFNFRNPGTTSQLVNTELFSSNPRPNPLKQNLAAEFQNPPENYKSNKQHFSHYNGHLNGFDQAHTFMTLPTPIITIPTTTPKPKKLKPHQPPLAIFLTQEAKKNDQIKVGDVLYSLKNANTVAVLDSVNPINAPKVFIGPNSLTPPENYVKFELPYLSNIEHTDKKLRQLPFFVAPLSYNTPQGFAKIPFPSPHVGSVVINSQIRETSPPLPTTNADVFPNSYTAPPQYAPKDMTQKPRFSYYSTVSPKPNAPEKYEPNYYSFEPQTVSTVRPFKESEASVGTVPPKSGSYFLSNVGTQHDPSQYVNFPKENIYKTPDYNVYRTTSVTTTTASTTTKPPTTYPSQLLETHNPYSINQAFHFSTPVDYQNFFDEYKDTHSTAAPNSQTPVQQTIPTPHPTEKSNEGVTEKSTTQHQQTIDHHQHSPPTYEQNYTPEIHYESEIPHSRYPSYNSNEYTTNGESYTEFQQFQPSRPVESNENNIYQPSSPTTPDITQQSEGNLSPPQENGDNFEAHPQIQENLTEPPRNGPVTFLDQSTKSPYEYNQYETAYAEEKEQSSTSSTTTTTTRRTPLRTRGRPRYSTTKSDNEEYSTRSTVTRRPLRERRPIPPRPRYEPNKITGEPTTRKPIDSSQSTTARTYRTRSRGKVHYKPSEADDTYDKKNKQNSKEADLAYQRDVLHQNYPVTLMERMSTVDIEAITEPTLKVSSTNNVESTNPFDAENAYSNDQVSITQHTKVYTESNVETATYLKQEAKPDDTYVPRISSTHPEDYIYHSRSSAAPIESFSSNDETKEDDNFSQQTTPIPKIASLQDTTSTKITYSASEHDNFAPLYNSDVPTSNAEDEVTNSNIEQNKPFGQETHQEPEEQEENIVQTTPSYNRVRVRPGVIRQYHQASSTESSRVKNDKRKSAQPITYRPAFDRRRTTMRIDEIQADLKTKQVLAHPENHDVHPVYKPEPTTEPSAVSATLDSASKRGQFRRRRPSYTQTTTTTDSSTTKKTYEIKNRFRGRRPTTEKPTDKPEVQTDEATAAAKTNLYNRYSHRPRLSERFHKKTEPEAEEGTEDQDPNYSLHRPKYAIPDTNQWSSKFSSDSFKPYNPNDVSDASKPAATELKSSNDELDIITAKNEYEDILISVTPASNNKANKIPDIPPTLEALVEQSKITKTDSGDTMSTFESMLEEVMKSLEEQDQDEYTTNVMKHKGGEIGEIPPEKIISSGDTYPLKYTTPIQEEATTLQPNGNESSHGASEEDATRKSRRRGFWKKVRVRPATESIEVAESQYYSNTVNRLGQNVNSKEVHGKSEKNHKLRVTTYKPSQQFIQNLMNDEDAPLDILVSHLDIPKINTGLKFDNKTEYRKTNEEYTTKKYSNKPTTIYDVNPGDMDLGTGSPDPTLEDEMYYSISTEAPIGESSGSVDRSDGFSLMDYLFGVTSSDHTDSDNRNKTEEITKRELEKTIEAETTTEQKPKIVTTESSYIPEEITAEFTAIEYETTEKGEIRKVSSSENTKQNEATPTIKPVAKVESTSMSSFIDPSNIVSTSMSTEVSHETEICFRGKCIKTNKDML